MPNDITLDLETTGTNVMRDLPVQIAVLVCDNNGNEISAESHIINPEMPISEGAARVHGISKEIAQRQGKSLSWMASRWHRIVWENQPAVLLGYNVINFDFPILQRVCHKYTTGKFKFPPLERVVDVMHLTSRFFQTKKWFRLQEAVNRLGIPHREEDFHDALADVRYTYAVYRKLIGRY